jgi:hypothetical protein
MKETKTESEDVEDVEDAIKTLKKFRVRDCWI